MRPDRQSRGVRARLLDRVKGRRAVLDTSVDPQNVRAVDFYRREGFVIIGESVCEHTDRPEHLMRWTAAAGATDATDATPGEGAR